MFCKNGREIQRYASFLTVVMILPSIILGLVAFFFAYTSFGEEGLIIGAVIAAIIILPTVFWARLFGSVLHGFGIIVAMMELWDPRPKGEEKEVQKQSYQIPTDLPSYDSKSS